MELQLPHVTPVSKAHVKEHVAIAERGWVVEAVLGTHNYKATICGVKEGLDGERKLQEGVEYGARPDNIDDAAHVTVVCGPSVARDAGE